jgi:hypothetical protein
VDESATTNAGLELTSDLGASAARECEDQARSPRPGCEDKDSRQRRTQFITHRVNIGMANAAVEQIEQHVIGTDGPALDLHRFQRTGRRWHPKRAPGMDYCQLAHARAPMATRVSNGAAANLSP